jgi:hypothetical protein
MKSVRIRSEKPRRNMQAPRSAPKAAADEERQMLIAKRAYELYSERGFGHGHALDDWLEAEREILSRTPP